jgi:hypothetical protein
VESGRTSLLILVEVVDRPAPEIAASYRPETPPPGISTQTPAATRGITPTITALAHVPPMGGADGKRSVWLWTQDGKVPASLAPTPRATERRLTPGEIARLLLADPPRTMPAIRTTTGIADPYEAVAHLRTWLPRTVVSLDAAVLAGRQVPKALQQPTRPNLDGTVRTVSGGLPSLNKRRR